MVFGISLFENGIARLSEYFSYGFVRRAMLIAILISLSAALIGVVLVLKRYSLLGDGLSHIAFGAVTVAATVGLSDTWITLPVTVLAAILILGRRSDRKIMGDAVIALLSTGALALGYTVMSVGGGVSNLGGDVCTALFGSSEIFAVDIAEVIVTALVTVALVVLTVVFYYKIFSITFDERFVRATGGRVDLYNTIFSAIVAVVIVLGMKLAGALLISSLIIFPAMSAMRVCKSFKGVLIVSGIISVIGATLGVLISILLGTPIGATIAAVDILIFAVFSLIGTKK